MNVIGKYKNGNYGVVIMEDGSKMRYSKLDAFEPEKPESIDLKISNKCYGMNGKPCVMCHEASNPEGEHGDILNLKFLDTMLPYTEVAIGGGNPLLHPDLVKFLEELKERNLIANMTVNQLQFMDSRAFIKDLVDRGLIHGLGISLVDGNDDFLEAVKEFPNAVIHIINGMVTIDQLRKIAFNDLKILILGYKKFRNGADLYEKSGDKIEERKTELYDKLKEIIDDDWFKVVSFDNLAIEQLDVKRLMDEDDFAEFFLGDDGKFSLYVDSVNNEFAKSSVSTERFPIEDDIKDMFEKVNGDSDAE